jgi:hypothetical protein
VRLHGALVRVDEATGRAVSIERVDEPGASAQPSELTAAAVFD